MRKGSLNMEALAYAPASERSIRLLPPFLSAIFLTDFFSPRLSPQTIVAEKWFWRRVLALESQVYDLRLQL